MVQQQTINPDDIAKRSLIVGIILFLIIFAWFIALQPLLKPWWAQQTGKAELAQAEQNRQIAIKEAEAVKESAKLLADAEVERARGVAEANQIIGNSLRENEAYLRYLWIQGLHDGTSEVIYVPTETNLPVLEATRLVN